MAEVANHKTENSQIVQIFHLCKLKTVSPRGIFWNTLMDSHDILSIGLDGFGSIESTRKISDERSFY